MSDQNIDSSAANWQRQLEQILSDHFTAAHGRVDEFYLAHLASTKSVFKRHWQHKKDIPRDLASIPRSGWRLIQRGMNRGNPPLPAPPLSGKEQHIANAIAAELMQFNQLEQRLLQHINQHPTLQIEQQAERTYLLNHYNHAEALQRVNTSLSKLTVSQDGSRDSLLFLSLGIVGRSLSDKVAFGSAIGLGSVTAGSIYISQQSTLSALWAQWFGVPAWVSAVGAASGVLIMLCVAPLVSPLVELGINKLRAKKMLHTMIDKIQHQLNDSGHDAASIAGYSGTYLQILPDLLQLLRGH